MLLPMRKMYFYIPLAYFFSTRISNLNALISWIVFYLSPIFVMSFLYKGYSDFYIYLLEIFFVISIYSVYEFGYICNDTITIKKEKKPTLRMSHNEILYAQINIELIFAVRLTLSAFLISIACGDLRYITIPILIYLCYGIYNSIRSRLNLPLHFILVIFRFSTPYIFFLGIHAGILSIMFFPLINTLERCTEERFEFECLFKYKKKIPLLRVIYFLTLTILFVFLYEKTNYINIQDIYMVSFICLCRTIFFLRLYMIK